MRIAGIRLLHQQCTDENKKLQSVTSKHVLAEILQISLRQFIRAFRKKRGKSPLNKKSLSIDINVTSMRYVLRLLGCKQQFILRSLLMFPRNTSVISSTRSTKFLEKKSNKYFACFQHEFMNSSKSTRCAHMNENTNV